ncbi:GMC family oxidoreductase N-terminal domain-containing protein [Phaeobacter sp. J2-8]|uniref:GMC family oxidoreductase n=1 Tax=Phaeobacter sp. J2-8 TaxID=2931394 RepID=UPI001FD5C9CA|nr:GMC family oxidoreductase N-terminal domain-containing protein [Phaeobacter sp. J2-8]MCJ7873497.1 GMC family oxidoreductase N-terminal domain-containing protein [Phaeobacter sp. J2-8]
MKTYDYIVVGAGAGGSAAASRLAQGGRHSVLLIEAGRDDPWHWLRVPLGIGKVLTGKRALWRYWTAPEPHLNNREIFWPRGRVWGGTSTVNGMLWVRGDPAEYNSWAAQGCDGWDHASLLPRFQRMESTTLGEDAQRGRDGPVHVTRYGPDDPLSDGFIAACEGAGIARTDDYNGAQYGGVAYLQTNTRRGLRHGAREAYLHRMQDHAGLDILSDAVVQRVDFDGARAVSVVVKRAGQQEHYACRGEIILAAGAIDTPKLLELSGIGQGARLRQLGINVVHDLPGVGEGLRDHLHTRLSFRCRNVVTLNQIMHNPLRKALFGLRYLLRRDGLMSGSTSTVHALVRTGDGPGQPDMKLQLHPMSSADARAAGKLVFDRFPGFGIGTFPLRPRATGSVHLGSADPDTPPVIVANYLGNPEDLVRAVAGVRLARKVAQQPALAAFDPVEIRPGDVAQSDDDIAAFIRETGTTSYHPVGSCRMGEGREAVVDARLRVRGITGLRIADASIFPTMPSANTHAPSLLAGEMVADFILAGS